MCGATADRSNLSISNPPDGLRSDDAETQCLEIRDATRGAAEPKERQSETSGRVWCV